MKENEIQKTIIDYLLLNQIFCWRNNTGVARYQDRNGESRFIKYGKVGSSDIIGILPDGRFLAIEVKAPGKEPTERQAEFLQSIAENNGVAIVATSLNEVINDIEMLW